MSLSVRSLVQKTIKYAKRNSTIRFLTLYLPFNYTDQAKQLKHAHSLLHYSLNRGGNELSDPQKVSIRGAVDRLLTIDAPTAELALFLQIDLARTSDPVREIEAHPLKFKPYAQGGLSRCYNITQMTDFRNNTHKSLAVTISRDEAQLYQIEGKNIDKIGQIKNDVIYSDDKQARQVYAPIRYGSSKSSSQQYYPPEDKIKRSYQLADLWFTRKITDYIKQSFKNSNRYQLLSIFSNGNFMKFSDQFSTLRTRFEKIIPVDRIPNSENDIFIKVSKMLSSLTQQGIPKLTEVMQNRKLYSVGWEECLENLNSGRADTIYVPKNYEKSGYTLISDGTPYLSLTAVESSFPVNFLKYWIGVSAALQSTRLTEWDENIAAVQRRY